MCGIAASFSPQSPARPLDLARLRHRGPDSQGETTHEDGHVWLGHTRLAILDLSPAGSQPMLNPETGDTVVFNGEIYNHLELRRDLPSRAWRGTSDTETLLAAYQTWGPEMLSRLRGMFAFVLHDARRHLLFAARDRLGIKPLYYREDGDELRLCSEVRPLLWDGLQADDGALASYLALGAFPEHALPDARVRALPAGHSLTVDPQGRLEVSRYWHPQRPTRSAPPEAEVPALVRAEVERAVREHLLADVPVACFLSGGIDSSVLALAAARHLGGRLKTFSVGFAEKKYDETSIAEEVARRAGTEHTRLELSQPEILESVREAVGHMDLPSVDAVNTYIVAKAVAARGIKAALSGLGGDELFGGYPSFREIPRLRALALLPDWARAPLRLLGPRWARFAEAPPWDGIEAMVWARRIFWTRSMLAQAGLPPARAPEQPLAENLPDDFARVSWIEMSGYMRHLLLRDSDQMSMAVSLELRVPFLDHQLAETVLYLPDRAKTGYPGVKGLLVEAFRGDLPEAVHNRPKRGFELPMAEWLRGPLAEFARAGIDSVRLACPAMGSAMDAQWAAFEAGRLQWQRVWSLCVLGHWLTGRR